MVLSASIVLGCSSDTPLPVDPVDSTPPTVSLTISTDSASEDQSVSLVATAADNVGVTRVDFFAGATLLETSTAAPHTVDVDVTASDNGDHSYTAVARDAAGNETTSAQALLTVAIPNVPFTDDFDDESTDSLQWTILERFGASVSEVDGHLLYTMPATTSGDIPMASFGLRCHLTGNVDVRVDYEIVTWPTQSAVRTGLSIHGGAAQRTSLGAGELDGADSYLADHSATGGVVTWQPTTDMSGTLRMTRIGSTYTSHFWDGAAWQTLQTTTGHTDEVPVGVAIWVHQPDFINQEVVITFDNFEVVSGERGSCS